MTCTAPSLLQGAILSLENCNNPLSILPIFILAFPEQIIPMETTVILKDLSCVNSLLKTLCFLCEIILEIKFKNLSFHLHMQPTSTYLLTSNLSILQPTNPYLHSIPATKTFLFSIQHVCSFPTRDQSE